MINEEDAITGKEELKFLSDSTPYVEKLFGLSFKKGGKRELKTIVNYLKTLPINIYLKKISWNTIRLANFNDNIIMELGLADDAYVSDNFKNNAYEEHVRLYKTHDIGEFIPYICINCNNVTVKSDIDNFSVKDFIIERKLLPKDILRKRVEQVINQCKYQGIHVLTDDLKDFITEYLQKMFRYALKNKEFNYIVELKIAKYMTIDQFIEFKLILDIILNMLRNNETIPYNKIIKLATEYDKFESRFLKYIEKRIV